MSNKAKSNWPSNLSELDWIIKPIGTSRTIGRTQELPRYKVFDCTPARRLPRLLLGRRLAQEAGRLAGWLAG